ncbi:MAG: class I SAM-dependent rRNA methyltransferase [Elusimicrobia bacterium]|nr:class I SAM-dependent rRNA methyltransferase [Elusimicrobiota bacterium]
MNDLKIIKLKPYGEKRALSGHPWIFSNELEKPDKDIEPGSICRIVSSSNLPVGTGFFNPHSLISIRLLANGTKNLEPDFVQRRISQAIAARHELGIAESGRMFYGESDGIGGLIIDKYAGIVVVEMLSAGAEKLKIEIVKTIMEKLAPEAVFLKNSHEFRKLENLELYEETAFGKVPDTALITENGIKYEVPVKSGQKTGHFFDQRENRAFLAPYFKSRKVLDLYCYTGSFALTAAGAGAKTVWGVDSSRNALDFAVRNAALNNLADKVIFKKEDAEKILKAMLADELPEKPDFALLDPPNFVRSKKNISQARRLYIKLNAFAIGALPPDGYLATSSCSRHISREDFVNILSAAAAQARRKAILVELRGQAKDHPILLNMPETEYLHFALLRVL